MQPVRAAVLQLCATADVPRSVTSALRATERALGAGAGLVVLPEGYAGIGSPGDLSVREAAAFSADDVDRAASTAPWLGLSRTSDAVFVLGGVPERLSEGGFANTLLVVFAGRVQASYRKIHLFRASLSKGERHDEASTTVPGRECVVADTPAGRLGASICFDLRFPELYAELAALGAEILLAPSAFTRVTGAAHFELLVRTRAIETQCFCLAAAQYGSHADGRASHGQSLIVDPWGTVLAAADLEHEAVLLADLDPGALVEVRGRIDLGRRPSPETSDTGSSLTLGAPPRRGAAS